MTFSLNNVPYLRTSRSFPEDLGQISVEIDKAYIDIANAVNLRTIGIFSTFRPTISGESWYFESIKRHQGIRQLYLFTTLASIPHGLNLATISMFTRCYGTYTDGTNWYGLIHGYTVAIPGQISFYVTPTDIVFVSGGGALVPGPLFKGNLVLEWVSNV